MINPRWLRAAVAGIILTGAAACGEDRPADPMSAIVEASEVFLATLDATEKTKVPLGIKLGDLDTEELAAAKSVLRTALGTGFDRVTQILQAADQLPGGSGSYSLTFLGTPTAAGSWELHFRGRLLAVTRTYRAGAVAGASPFFVASEPAKWTSADGETHAPLDDMRKAVLAMTGSLSGAQQAKAKLRKTYSDVLAGPFPRTKQGLAVSALSAEQQKLVLAAVQPWVAGERLLSTYAAELDGTFIGWSGTPGLTNHADYVRIDGPRVWVEFVCQDGKILRDKISYRTVYRDRSPP
ncbi:DUF3500 domain-containing protein [Actinoplanes friuliensis]|uniref:Lipoprotein n=1 Tax=Actinoplanes friuliensis DSM 7358 TaxID=1246995 RepID=U5VXN5_9ACTN|nr:DUF3500 domain-containing protein [Actinoplanes friuliensis]AGZ41619.1 hypothetical protein AFR_16705 [Actinoplanes friuliensis DSM 7358]